MPRLRIVLLLCFALSGFSGLVFEVVWSRLLVHVFGATLPALSTVLAVFMGGLAAGAYLAGRFWSGKDPPIVYALLELVVGAYALAVPFLLSQSFFEPIWQAVYGSLSESALGLFAARLLLSFLLLSVPTICMGATFTVISRFLSDCSPNPARDIGYLYAANTAGAVAGALLSGFVLVPWLGLSRTVYVAAAANVVVAAIVLACRRLESSAETAAVCEEGRLDAPDDRSHDLEKAASADAPLPVTVVLSLGGCAGALFMVLEVAWTRFFSLVFGSTTYAFSIVLALVLAGLAAGSWAAAALAARSRIPLAFMILAQVFSGFYLYGTMFFANEMPWWLLDLTQALSRQSTGVTFASAILVRALIASVVVFPPSVLSGAVFSLFVRTLAGHGAATGGHAGRLFAANTAGAIAGSLMGVALISKLGEVLTSGMQATILLVAALELLLAAVMLVIWCRLPAKHGRTRLASAVIVVCGLGLIVVGASARHLDWDPAILSSGVSFYSAGSSSKVTREKFLEAVGARKTEEGHTQILLYHEGLNTTVTVATNPQTNVTYLKNDGKVEASVPTDPSKPAPYSDVATHVLLGSLPVLLHPHAAADAFLLGYGTGTTAGALLANPEVEHLQIAELEKAVVAADKFFIQANGRPLRQEWKQSGRVQMLVNDGRLVLSGSPKKFDVIVSQPADPCVNGMTDLFTREFWHIAASRLKQGGLMAQWIQLYAITPEYLGILLRTFHDAFPYTMLFHPPNSGELILVGSRTPVAIDGAKLDSRLQQREVARVLSKAGVTTVADVMAMLARDPRAYSAFCDKLARDSGDNRLNTDDNLLTEYQLPRQLFTSPAIVPATVDLLNPGDRASGQAGQSAQR